MKTLTLSLYSAALLSIIQVVVLLSSHYTAATQVPRTCWNCEGINCQRTTHHQAVQCLDALDYCVTIYDKETVIHKGCSSELPVEWRRHCDANMPSCRKCFGNACNDLGPVTALCVQCDSAQDANCANAMDAIIATPCDAATASNTYCYVRYAASSNGRAMTTQRGCAVSDEAQTECFNSASCELCLPSDARGCNNYNFTPNTR